MPPADPTTYLADLVQRLKAQWPDNHTLNIACHGHSVPAGYFATPLVRTFDAYPHLLHAGLKDRFPYAVINVVVTATGGEESDKGARRFERDVLAFHPTLVTIDYGLNDRRIGLAAARDAWRAMIEAALAQGARLLLLTPTADVTFQDGPGQNGEQLSAHAAQIRALAAEYGVGLVDSLAAFERYRQTSGPLSDLLAWPNHPNRRGHELVARELLRFFPVSG